MLLDVRIGDVVMMRKPHPCGSTLWTVRRIGADIGLICQGCGHRIMLPRRKFNKSVKKLISRVADADPGTTPPCPPTDGKP